MLASKEYYDYYYSRPANARLKKPIYNPRLQFNMTKGYSIRLSLLIVDQQKFGGVPGTGEIEEQSEYIEKSYTHLLIDAKKAKERHMSETHPILRLSLSPCNGHRSHLMHWYILFYK